MRIGIDFDNTLVNYEGVFYETALQRQWIPEDTGKSKVAVKAFFISTEQESKWTELQGLVYGHTIANAIPYPGIQEALQDLLKLGAELFIVSHKTRYPVIGDKLDFHAAARRWIDQHKLHAFFSGIYFCAEKDTKVAQISDLNLDWFVDDLPSVLQHPCFPESTHKILFGADDLQCKSVIATDSWSNIPGIIREHDATS